MQIQKDLWLENGYYIDFDRNGFLKIVGPENHLYLGLCGITRKFIKIEKILVKEKKLYLGGKFFKKKMALPLPLIGDVYTLRKLTEGYQNSLYTLSDIRKKYPYRLIPNYVDYHQDSAFHYLVFQRKYGNDWYGITLKISQKVKFERKEGLYQFESKTSKIPFTIIVSGSFEEPTISGSLFQKDSLDFNKLKLSDKILVEEIFKKTTFEIDHLLKYKKTSGYSFGSILPRDWTESAFLAEGDLEPGVIDYMFYESIRHIDKNGQGWYRNIVGEKAHNFTDLHLPLVDRRMIDIEPRYILGTRICSPAFLKKIENFNKIRQICEFVIKKASQNDLICFKKKPSGRGFFKVGNWRDSREAYKEIHPIIAPFDVNAVFYPAALQRIKELYERWGFSVKEIEPLIQKWEKVKTYYKFANSDGTSAYALALYDIRKDENGKLIYSKLKVNHTDEAYDLVFGKPSEEDVYFFTKRLINPSYFYTKSGPTIVGKNDDYPTYFYHGQVIWTKQTTFCMVGLIKQLKRGQKEGWRRDTLDTIKDGISKLYKDLFKEVVRLYSSLVKTYKELGGIPDLHYDKDGRAQGYEKQKQFTGPADKIRLWSAIGARRIIREYYAVADLIKD